MFITVHATFLFDATRCFILIPLTSTLSWDESIQPGPPEETPPLQVRLPISYCLLQTQLSNSPLTNGFHVILFSTLSFNLLLCSGLDMGVSILI